MVLDDFSDLKILSEYCEYRIRPRPTYITKELFEREIMDIEKKINICSNYFENLSKTKKEFLADKESLADKIRELEENNILLPKFNKKCSDFEIIKKKKY